MKQKVHPSSHSIPTIPKRNFRILPTRRCRLTILCTEQELTLWSQKAAECGMSFSGFGRECLDAYTFRNCDTNPVESQLQTELSQIQNILRNLELKFNLTLPQILNQIAAFSPDNLSLEKKIREILTGQSLFLNNLAAYCGESAQNVLGALCKMRSKNIVTQDIQMRWVLI